MATTFAQPVNTSSTPRFLQLSTCTWSDIKLFSGDITTKIEGSQGALIKSNMYHR